jgi:hypothetical protein
MVAFNRKLARIARKVNAGTYVDRDTYESTSDASFYHAHGIPRATWYRQMAKGNDAFRRFLDKHGVLNEWDRLLSGRNKKREPERQQPISLPDAPQRASFGGLERYYAADLELGDLPAPPDYLEAG